MKKSICAVLAIFLLASTGFTQGQQDKVSLPQFKKITVNARIDIELVQSDTQEAWFNGDKKWASNVRLTVSGDELTVESKYPLASYKNKLTLTICVAQLKALQVNSNSIVTTTNMLDAPELLLTINSDCEVKLQTNGKVVCSAIEPYEYAYEYRKADNRMSVDPR